MSLGERPDEATIAAYLRRIGFDGNPKPDLDTLKHLHRQHLHSISYDALDIQLGRPVSLDPREAFTKLVQGRRGGWCYEMNGLFAWMLEGVGFKVMRMAGTVMRGPEETNGRGDHLVLLIDLGRPYFADVGFGEGPQEPFPLVPGSFDQQGSTYLVEMLDGGWWRLSNQTLDDAPPFDFRTLPANFEQLEMTNHHLQNDPESPFVLNAIVARGIPDGFEILRGRVLTTVRAPTTEKRLLSTASEYVDVLRDQFGIDLPEAAGLWPRIVARHEAVFGSEAAAGLS